MLVLGAPAPDILERVARVLEQGLLVVMVSQAEVPLWRKASSTFENVMVVESDPDGSIPWRNEFFSKLFALDATEPTAEMTRVVQPDGRLYLRSKV